jgi:hypothetical protein
MVRQLFIAVLCATWVCVHEFACPRTTFAGETLAGKPHWLALGGEVYHARERHEAQRQILSFHGPPRWFGIDTTVRPFPKRLEDLPTTDRGVKLALSIQPTRRKSLLRFQLTLSATREPVYREVEHSLLQNPQSVWRR